MSVGLTLPSKLLTIPGIRLAACSANIYPNQRDDLVLIELAQHTNSAALFTQNPFKAAPVQIAEQHLQQARPRYLLINAGNANAGTGETGIADAQAINACLSRLGQCKIEQVLPFSTGVIGEDLPRENILDALPTLFKELSSAGWLKAAYAIMSTDTLPKACSKKFNIANVEVSLTGITKGAGMIKPNMATMLAFMATDITIDKALLHTLLTSAAAESFNCLSIDGDASSNDSCVLMATGENKKLHISDPNSEAYHAFSMHLNEFSIELAQKIARDGEGAKKFITIHVENGRDSTECKKIAYSIANSLLVKTAMTASDPNWGRLLVAIGNANTALDINRIHVYLNELCIVTQGCRAKDYTEAAGQRAMSDDEINIRVDLNQGGEARACVWSCDLSHDYVTINAEYRS